MPRRGENIRKRKDGRWEARYPSGVKEDGRKVYTSVYGATYREVKEKRYLATQTQSSRSDNKVDTLLFGDILQRWINDNQVRLKEATKYRYRYLIETHILPQLGNMKLNMISCTVINAFVAEKMNHGRIDGTGGLSAAYVRSIVQVINSALSFAAENKIDTPVPTRITKPALQPRELPILSKENQTKLENILLTDMDCTKLGVYISLYTGLRIGEICALRWEDIDLENQVIYVRHTVVRVKVDGQGSTVTTNVIDQPKTKTSCRCVPICSRLLLALQRYSPKTTSEYVVSKNRTFASPRTFEYRYCRLLESNGIPHINYHGLRHTFATRCIEAGMDVKSLSEILGHANVTITLNTYVHSSMELKRTQLEKLVCSGV